MVTIRPKKVVQMGVTGRSRSHSRTDVEIRDLVMTIDEPVERGGTNAGAAPVETVLAALAACTNRIGHKVAAKHGVPIDEMEVEVTTQFDRRGVELEEEIDVPFREVALKIRLVTDAPEEAIGRLKRDLPKYCPVSKLISESGSKLTEEWTVVRPAAAIKD